MTNAPFGSILAEMVKMRWPVFPYQGVRTVDAWGSGAFGANRERRTAGVGEYGHKGLDIKGEPGDSVCTSFPCVVNESNGVAYPGSDLGSIHLLGLDEFSDFKLKLLYVKPMADVIVGEKFAAGGGIGWVQGVAGYWQAKEPHSGPMTNHIHFELYQRVNGIFALVDPAQYLVVPE